MIRVERLPEEQQQSSIDVSPDTLAALGQWISQEIEDAISARFQWETLVRELLRMYEGVPKNPVKNTPVENAPNIEVTLGAIATDAIFAQSIDLLYTASPLVTCRPASKRWNEHAKALQRFVDWGTAKPWNVRPASEHTILDNVQLGTGLYYIPYVEQHKITGTHRILRRGPQVYSIPPEDFFVPGGADADLQWTRWAGHREWLGEHELTPKAKELGWDIDGVLPTGVVGWIRSRRETLGRTWSSRKLNILYEIYHLYVLYDINGDGMYEDLKVVWDRASHRVLKVDYNPLDHRPYEGMRYQIRAHIFAGIGVMEMLRGFQEELTTLHNHRTLNLMLANARIWKSKRGAVPATMKLWPNKIIELDDPDSLKPEQMGDVYPSAAQGEAITIGLAERRTGSNELSLPRPSQVMGSRTPGITALSLLQQINRRFTPAFDQVKNATAGAVMQCVYRYQERILAGDEATIAEVQRVVDEKEFDLLLELFREGNFADSVQIVMTASTANVNREAERQNSIMLVNVLSQYYERVLQLVALASNPQTPREVQDVAKKIASKAGEIIDRTLRTFDQIRDPDTFLVNISGELDSIQPNLSAGGLNGLMQIIQSIGAQSENGTLNPATVS